MSPAYEAKLAALADVIIAAAPDVVAVQEIGDEASFEALRVQLGAGWSGVLSTHFESAHPIRVGWLSPGRLGDVEEVTDLPAALVPVQVGDDDTTINQLGRGALAVTYTSSSGTVVRALSVHLKSKLLSFPGGRFDTDDEDERARYGVYALDRRAAEAAAVRAWATASLAGAWADKPLLVCGDLNDTLDAATTQLVYGPPGSQIGTGGFTRPDHGDPQRLWDVGYAMSPPNNYSRINEGRQETHRPHPGIGHPRWHAAGRRHRRARRAEHRRPPRGHATHAPTLRPPTRARPFRRMNSGSTPGRSPRGLIHVGQRDAARLLTCRLGPTHTASAPLEQYRPTCGLMNALRQRDACAVR